jgi:predicted negative regulator of RcsB-dependent stress response
MEHIVPPVVNVAHKSRFDAIPAAGPFNVISIIAVIVIAAVGFWLWRKWQAKAAKRKSRVSFAKPVAQLAPEPEPEVEEEEEEEEEEEPSKEE